MGKYRNRKIRYEKRDNIYLFSQVSEIAQNESYTKFFVDKIVLIEPEISSTFFLVWDIGPSISEDVGRG